jgi:hypothetical protein
MEHPAGFLVAEITRGDGLELVPQALDPPLDLAEFR